MAELHEALQHLTGVDWNDVPQDNLEQYMNDCFRAGELICNSVPPIPNGTSFADSKPHHSTPNSAKSHKDMHPSEVRAHPPHRDHETLQSLWGKPIKFKPADNPLQVSLYKMAGKDRHGAWFARKSVHEGLGFDKWKKAFLAEFATSMAVSGGPGAGAIRGLGADRRLEKVEVPGTGKVEVYQLSAQFPGPVTPRDFIAMLVSDDDALTDKSMVEVEGGKRYVPRHYMVVSKPVEHPDAPLRSGYVRGHYESVEMVREIPLSTTKSKAISDTSSKDDEPHAGDKSKISGATGTSESDTESGKVDETELNPVEWIMITRSDPGGGIPRFLVDRGTPETMIADVHKFFDWACGLDHIPDPETVTSERGADSGETARGQEQADDAARESGTTSTETASDATRGATSDELSAGTVQSGQQSGQQGGIISNLTKAVEAGVGSYAPTSVSNLLLSRPEQDQEQDSSDSSSDTSSVDSFMSAEELTRLSPAPEEQTGPTTESADSLSIASGDLSTASKDPKDMTSHEKEILKLGKKREKLEQTLAKKRMAEESKLRQSQEKDESESSKLQAETEKKLKRTEEKHRKEIEKIEAKKAKEIRKAEEKRQKRDESKKLSLVARERDEFRSQGDMYRRENELLRDQVADLQAQNNLLAQKLGEIGGQEAVRSSTESLSHGRSKSTKSLGIIGSSESLSKDTDKKAEANAAAQ